MSSRSPICATCSSASSRATPRPTTWARCCPGLGRLHRPRLPSISDARGAVATLTDKRNYPVKIRPLHPDHCCGLRKIGDVAMLLNLTLFVLGIYVSLKVIDK